MIAQQASPAIREVPTNPQTSIEMSRRALAAELVQLAKDRGAAYAGAGPRSRLRGAPPDRSSAIRDTKDKGAENTSRSGLRRASVAQRADITTKSRAVGSK